MKTTKKLTPCRITTAKLNGVFDPIINKRFDFEKYINENLETWDLFQYYTLKAIDSGAKKISSEMIVNRIRWEVNIERGEGDRYKINDHVKSYLSRLFVFEFPEYAFIFDFRDSRKKYDGIDEKYNNER